MYSNDELITIITIAHAFAQLQGDEDARIREVAQRCRAVERLCTAIAKGARDSALPQAHHTLSNLMTQAVKAYNAKPNQDAPPGWVDG